jgi:hypothetical protein
MDSGWRRSLPKAAILVLLPCREAMMSPASQLFQTMAFACDQHPERNRDAWRDEASAPE